MSKSPEKKKDNLKKQDKFMQGEGSSYFLSNNKKSDFTFAASRQKDSNLNYSDKYSQMAFKAIQKNDQESLISLLSQNLADLNAKEKNLAAGDFDGRSLLDAAIDNYNLEICKILIYYGTQKGDLGNLNYGNLLYHFFEENNKEGVNLMFDLFKWQQTCQEWQQINLTAELPVEEDF